MQYGDKSDYTYNFKGTKALENYKKWKKKLDNQKYCSLSNQNTYYGDFRATRKKDKNGLPVYLQLRCNFNNQEEILNTVETKVYTL